MRSEISQMRKRQKPHGLTYMQNHTQTLAPQTRSYREDWWVPEVGVKSYKPGDVQPED